MGSEDKRGNRLWKGLGPLVWGVDEVGVEVPGEVGKETEREQEARGLETAFVLKEREEARWEGLHIVRSRRDSTRPAACSGRAVVSDTVTMTRSPAARACLVGRCVGVPGTREGFSERVTTE